MLRLHTPLPDDLEHLAHDVIGSCIEVHRLLGPGLLEQVYGRAVVAELRSRGIAFEAEKQLPVGPVNVAQVLTYLRIADVRLGLLINFNVPVLHRESDE